MFSAFDFFSCKSLFISKSILILQSVNIRLQDNKKQIIMKKELHPDNYRLVAFKDMSNGETFISKSTINAKETIEIDGVEYPLMKVEISNTSHPFFTGKMKLVDTAGRVDKFRNRYKKHLDKKTDAN